MAAIAGWTDRIHNEASADSRLRQMTGDQSRLLKGGARVLWDVTTTDLCTLVGTACSGVTIDWDDGHTSSIQHNDMAQVERVPVMLEGVGNVHQQADVVDWHRRP